MVTLIPPLAILDLNEPVDLVIFIGFIVIVVLAVLGRIPWHRG